MKNINAQFYNEKLARLETHMSLNYTVSFLKWVVLVLAWDSFTDLMPNVK